MCGAAGGRWTSRPDSISSWDRVRYRPPGRARTPSRSSTRSRTSRSTSAPAERILSATDEPKSSVTIRAWNGDERFGSVGRPTGGDIALIMDWRAE
jgi:hypothetical protein